MLRPRRGKETAAEDECDFRVRISPFLERRDGVLYAGLSTGDELLCLVSRGDGFAVNG